MNAKNASKRWPTAIDLYSGSGAVSAALKRLRIRVVAAVDNDPVACMTYRLNYPSAKMIERDIRKVDPAELRPLLNGEVLDLLVVCAPCQPFSSQNRKRGDDDRSSLILESARFARVLKPRIIFFENVPGLASPAHAHIIDELRKALGKDYTLSEPHKVDAADYGVPQRRVRCILLASRNAEPPPLPLPTTPRGKRVTVRAAIGGLRPRSPGQKDKRDELHSARDHSDLAIQRLQAIPRNGGSRSSLPVHLQLQCHKDLGASAFSDVYGRMSWKDVAPTLTTGCTDVTRGRFAHPRDNRAITLREASLLQTFPRNHKFAGSSTDIQRQIGNAVPSELVVAIVSPLRALLSGK
jgi:DNA (cytosine-5)-methyltransferase 1